MIRRHDLRDLDWWLAGFTPNQWLAALGEERMRDSAQAEVAAIPARVPGSVHGALLAAGLIEPWDRGMNSLACEWVENRHWVFEAAIPDEWIGQGAAYRFICEGCDYSGWIYVGDALVSAFRGGHAPVLLDLTSALRPSGNWLRVIFDNPPRYLGYTGFTSRFTDWKPRFCYSWDWMVRMVTVGMWERAAIEVGDGRDLSALQLSTDADPKTGRGWLRVTVETGAQPGDTIAIGLHGADGLVWSDETHADALGASGLEVAGLPVQLWWPNGQGSQPLYELEVSLRDAGGAVHDTVTRRVGFRSVRWEACEGAPPEADPWLCVVNGRPVFVQGVNWTPIRPNFHDVGEDVYRQYLERYRKMGVNSLRVWGGGILEKDVFYDLCDEMGILVWQEFPLSSSTFENWPPEDERAIAEMVGIAESAVARRGHHASLAMWCGGNELHRAVGEGAARQQIPVDLGHPMMRALADAVGRSDPKRRFVPTSPSGPRFFSSPVDLGKGLHWDVHGPWRPEAGMDRWREYWEADDALLRSEVGCPGASPPAILHRYCAHDAFVKPTADGPEFRRQFDGWWWMEWSRFEEEHAREPETIEEFADWSRNRQAEALSIAARACKSRFPRCGGIVLWMGHDSFPCSANTSVFDYHGDPKPAVATLREVFAEESTDR